MSDITYKGRNVWISSKAIDKSLEERQEGESWLDMRNRTQTERDRLELENKQVEKELKELLNS